MSNDGLPFTAREIEVMQILWDQGSATINEARASDRLDGDRPYTSHLSIFQTLENKGYVRHKRDGRAYRYYPLISREEAQQEAVDFVADRYFDGDREALETVAALGADAYT